MYGMSVSVSMCVWEMCMWHVHICGVCVCCMWCGLYVVFAIFGVCVCMWSQSVSNTHTMHSAIQSAIWSPILNSASQKQVHVQWDLLSYLCHMAAVTYTWHLVIRRQNMNPQYARVHSSQGLVQLTPGPYVLSCPWVLGFLLSVCPRAQWWRLQALAQGIAMQPTLLGEPWGGHFRLLGWFPEALPTFQAHTSICAVPSSDPPAKFWKEQNCHSSVIKGFHIFFDLVLCHAFILA